MEVLDDQTIASRIFERVRGLDQIWGTYALDLTLDAMLEYFLATGAVHFRDHVLAVMYRRNPQQSDLRFYETRPFGHIQFNIYRCLGDSCLADAFVAESELILRQVDRSEDGLVLHRGGDGQARVLVDFLQDYIARMARAGSLTGKAEFLEEAGMQASLHRNLLRCPQSGLWHQGRDWEPRSVSEISPGAWSRGQGWILRGLLDSLDAFPDGCPQAKLLHAYLIELLGALLPRQAESGFWHCLVDHDPGDSAPETSGTALITTALYRSLAAGYIEGPRFRHAADRGWEALSQMVDETGKVSGACAGPGPLNQHHLEERYLRKNFSEAEDHGWFTILYACAARAGWLRVSVAGDCQTPMA